MGSMLQSHLPFKPLCPWGWLRTAGWSPSSSEWTSLLVSGAHGPSGSSREATELLSLLSHSFFEKKQTRGLLFRRLTLGGLSIQRLSGGSISPVIQRWVGNKASLVSRHSSHPALKGSTPSCVSADRGARYSLACGERGRAGSHPRAVTLSLGHAGAPLPSSSGWSVPGGGGSPWWLLGPWDLGGTHV